MIVGRDSGLLRPHSPSKTGVNALKGPRSDGWTRHCEREASPSPEHWICGDGCLVQPVLDLVEAGDRAGFILVAAGRAGRRDAADRIVADLDRHAARPGAEL